MPPRQAARSHSTRALGTCRSTSPTLRPTCVHGRRMWRAMVGEARKEAVPSEIRLMSPDEPSFFPELRRRLTAEPWCVDGLEIVQNQLILEGWALPIQGDPTKGAIYVNDREAKETSFGGTRPDIAHCYGYTS